MKVRWMGTQELISGVEKITLEAPTGTEDEVHMLKMAAKRGEELELRVIPKDMPVYQYESLLPLIRMIEAHIQKEREDAYQTGRTEALQKEFDEIVGEPNFPNGFEGKIMELHDETMRILEDGK